MTSRQGPDWASIVSEFPDLPDAPVVGLAGVQNGDTVFTDGVIRYEFGTPAFLFTPPGMDDAWERAASAWFSEFPPQLGNVAIGSPAWPEPDHPDGWYTAMWFDPTRHRVTPIYTSDPDLPFDAWERGVPS